MEDYAEHIVTADVNGKLLNGSTNYRLRLPGNIPAGNFWSVIVFDTQTKLMIRTDQSWPSIHSNCKNLVLGNDGTVEIFFGRHAPENGKCNWLQTIPGKGWYMTLNLYNPLDSWFNKTWECGEIEEIV